MNYAAWLFFGTFLTFATAWMGLVFAPNMQLRDAEAKAVDADSKETFPLVYSGPQSDGRKVFVAEGCTYCHTQQVRGGQYQADVERGWGPRRSVPQDYVHDNPVLLGTMRTGPDLINIGARQPSAEWHLRHLYDPQSTSPGSVMPPYSHLFEVRKIQLSRSADALDPAGLPEGSRPPEGYEIVPTDDARNLAAYLRGLDRTYPVDVLKEGGRK